MARVRKVKIEDESSPRTPTARKCPPTPTKKNSRGRPKKPAPANSKRKTAAKGKDLKQGKATDTPVKDAPVKNPVTPEGTPQTKQPPITPKATDEDAEDPPQPQLQSPFVQVPQQRANVNGVSPGGRFNIPTVLPSIASNQNSPAQLNRQQPNQVSRETIQAQLLSRTRTLMYIVIRDNKHLLPTVGVPLQSKHLDAIADAMWAAAHADNNYTGELLWHITLWSSAVTPPATLQILAALNIIPSWYVMRRIAVKEIVERGLRQVNDIEWSNNLQLATRNAEYFQRTIQEQELAHAQDAQLRIATLTRVLQNPGLGREDRDARKAQIDAMKREIDELQVILRNLDDRDTQKQLAAMKRQLEELEASVDDLHADVDREVAEEADLYDSML